MTLITKGMGAIIKSLGKGKGQGMVKGAGKKAVPKAVPRAIPRPKKFRLTKTDDAFVAGAGIGTAVTSEIHREKNKTPSPHRTRKSLGGFLKGVKKVFTKKKPTPKPSKPEPKMGSKEWFDKQDPFVRNKILSIRASAKRGDVYNKAGTVVGTPNPHRTAETIMKRHPGSYQLSKTQTKSGKR
jgi:hypothetical protein